MKLFHHHHEHKSLAQMLPDENRESAAAIRRVVKIGCAVNIILMALKLCAGYFGHSDALFADGFHSLNDVAADLLMLAFVGISYRAADDRYAYGYGKFETFSSFVISALLLAISVMIGYEAVEKIVDYCRGEELAQPDIWTFIVVLFAMACKEGLFRFYSHAARKADSKALLANAWHHRTDAMASIATLIGVTFSHFFGPAFRILDPVASLVIALFIFFPALSLFRPSFMELMERSLPDSDVKKAREAVESVPGVDGIEYMRTRRNGHHMIFDVGILVAPGTTVEIARKVRNSIERALCTSFCPHVMVTVTPIPSEKPTTH